jgi:divalent metal cation (Fe/Co/Zn/Cd) transporter
MKGNYITGLTLLTIIISIGIILGQQDVSEWIHAHPVTYVFCAIGLLVFAILFAFAAHVFEVWFNDRKNRKK